MSIEKKKPLFVDPLEISTGLSIDDLNKYLPAIQKVSDLKMTAEKMKDGIFFNPSKPRPKNTPSIILSDVIFRSATFCIAGRYLFKSSMDNPVDTLNGSTNKDFFFLILIVKI